MKCLSGNVVSDVLMFQEEDKRKKGKLMMATCIIHHKSRGLSHSVIRHRAHRALSQETCLEFNKVSFLVLKEAKQKII